MNKPPRPVAVAVFAVFGGALLAAELYGVFTDHPQGDTISELVWFVRDLLPWPVRWAALVGLAGFFGWVMHHFATGGRRINASDETGDV